MKKTAVPKLASGDQGLDAFAEAVKQNLDRLTGQIKNAVALPALNEDASAADIINAVNAIRARLGEESPNAQAVDASLDDDTGVATGSSAMLTATQTYNNNVPIVVDGHTFTVPPGKTLTLTGQLIFTASVTTTGLGFGIRVAQPTGADGNAQGSWMGQVALQNAPGANQLYEGDVFNVAAGANTYSELLGTATTAGNNAASYQAVIKNTSTQHTTTVTVEFRSEVILSNVVLQIGSGCVGTLV